MISFRLGSQWKRVLNLNTRGDGKILASLALLSARWNDENKSYLDNFTLFAVNSIETKNNGIAKEKEASDSLELEFGFKLPFAVIRDILKRASKLGYGKFVNGYFHTNKDIVPGIVADMDRARFQSIREQETLIRKFVNFAKTNYGLNWEIEFAENILQDYVEKNGSFLLSQTLSSIPFPSQIDGESTEFVFFKWVEELLENDLTSFEWLEEMIKGAMLAMAIVLPTKLETSRRFKNTTIWLDTPLILQILGLRGSEMKDYTIEIINLAQKQNAKIRIFNHVLNESKGVIRKAASDIYNHDVAAKPDSVLSWFRKQNFTPSKVLLLLQGIEDTLLKLGIDFQDKPDVDPRFQIDESQFEKVLQNQVRYSSNVTLKVDLDSLVAIFTLRAGYSSDRLEDCRHVFLTDNDKLVHASSIFFKTIAKGWPVVMLDHIVASLIWVKSPMSLPDLPKKRIIADALASTHPNEALWKNFSRIVDELNQQDVISEDDLLLMREGPEVEKFLMEATAGGFKPINRISVLEVRDLIKDKISLEARRDVKEAEVKFEIISSEKAELEDKLSKSLVLIENEKIRIVNSLKSQSCFLKYSLKILFTLFALAVLFRNFFGISRVGFVANFQNWSNSVTGLLGIMFLLDWNLFHFADWCAACLYKRRIRKAMARFSSD